MKIIFALLALAAVADSAIAATPPQNAGAAKQAAPAATSAAKPTDAMPSGHAPAKAAADLGDVKVSKATGPNARTVAEVVTKRNELKDKAVVVRGKVVKFNPNILKMNWIHLRDGTGSEADNTNDILVTTNDSANVGDVVTVKGVVHIDKDLGMGYSYKVLIEEAKLQK